ncbi:hypothetical protein [Sporanaerobium hydrogeniformans]|nr:hypothetical protein [Sporanaerobium hydrogeniformans]
MRRRLMGLCCLCIGVGMLLVITLPIIGWVLLVGIGLICIGYKCFKC